MCRALKVLCVAPDAGTLAELKRAASSAEWELAPGATTEAEALAQLHAERPHVVVVSGPFEGFVRAARQACPFLRIVALRNLADPDVPGATVVAASLAEVRDAVKGLPRPGGPVR